MKKILGLDLGTTSIGWALVNEKEHDREQSSITKLGVRVVPLTVDEQGNYEKGKPVATNADRTLKRGMRRSLQRYKLRREHLIYYMKEAGWITDDTVLAEVGNFTTFETRRLRAKAATEEVTLEQLARVLLMINKKRGYKSSRKAKGDEDGSLIDGMSVAKEMYDNGLTPGQYMLRLLEKGRHPRIDFYRSDLQNEFDRIWTVQSQYYAVLTADLRERLRDKNGKQTWATCKDPFQIEGIKRTTKRGIAQQTENYQWRVKALTEKMGLEELAVVFQEINSQMSNSSGYLGKISDRSKELYFRHQTVGQRQMELLEGNPNFSLKNDVYYRQDYLDEFDTIWETQSRYHKELTPELKHDLRDITIFYQRPLKSQKGLISFCEFESRKIAVEVNGRKKQKTVGLRVCPKSSPLFQEFKIWQILNNLEIVAPDGTRIALEDDQRQMLAEELELRESMTKADALKIILKNPKGYDLNYSKLEGNRTQARLYAVWQSVVEQSGHDGYDFAKMRAADIKKMIEEVFASLGICVGILHFDASLEGKAFELQPAYQLWHLLYSYEGDSHSATGNGSLVDKLTNRYGFDADSARQLASVTFEDDYGSLSAKAMRKILVYMKEGNRYDEACALADYRHSAHSLTREEMAARPLKDRLELLPRGELRNPVVEKILNQTINVVNQIMDTYGRPDEIRIEMARELKKTAAQRADMTASIAKNTKDNEVLAKRIQSEFGIARPSHNDILRLRLYEELSVIGYKAPYSGKPISPTQLFSKEIDIEHIIPQARIFDDSLSNKTLEFRDINIEKGNQTALDYVRVKWGEKGEEEYRNRVEMLKGTVSRTKYQKLLWTEQDIPDDFLNRDLTTSQYIARKATEILEQVVRTVTPTVGSITDRLREDWQLVNVMQELNWDKYDRQGLTEEFANRDGQTVRRIKDWTKRNDHRHHAMDALAIAFTKRSIVQYLNNLNARSDKSSSIYGIEQNELERDSHNKLRFKAPFGTVDEFRAEAKRQLECVIVSQKAKNKVVTANTNTTKTRQGRRTRIQLTPRGQLHNETIYGSQRQYVTKEEKVGSSFDEAKIQEVASPVLRRALLTRLQAYGGDPKKAFTGANSLEKKPIYLNSEKTACVPPRVKTVTLETVYTIRKEVAPDLNVEKVVDAKVRRLLEARLEAFGGDPKKAFSNLDENPIWLNREKGIAVKRVTITGVSNAIALRDRHDHLGHPMADTEGNPIPTDFVNTGSNHHVAIFRDADGSLQEHVVSFYEATERTNQGLPVIDKEYRKDDGWTFLFTLKQNEYFVFPNPTTGFDPNEVDLLDPANNDRISPNLYRVQKFSNKDYFFRHHLETVLNDVKELKEIVWKRGGPGLLEGAVKVRVNHIGQIVSVGEY